jgi:hypothetical protein
MTKQQLRSYKEEAEIEAEIEADCTVKNWVSKSWWHWRQLVSLNWMSALNGFTKIGYQLKLGGRWGVALNCALLWLICREIWKAEIRAQRTYPSKLCIASTPFG